MKKILLLCFVWGIISCDNARTYQLESKNEALRAYNEKLINENNNLKTQLDYCRYGNPNEDIEKIGRWLDNRPETNIQLILNKNIKTGKFFLESRFDDGSSMIEQVRVSLTNGIKKIQSLESEQNEWFIIEKNGNLSMWSQNGKFGTALCF